MYIFIVCLILALIPVYQLQNNLLEFTTHIRQLKGYFELKLWKNDNFRKEVIKKEAKN